MGRDAIGHHPPPAPKSAMTTRRASAGHPRRIRAGESEKRMKRTQILAAGVFGSILTLGAVLFAADKAEHPSALFKEYCIKCHGEDGKAQTPKGKQLMAREGIPHRCQRGLRRSNDACRATPEARPRPLRFPRSSLTESTPRPPRPGRYPGPACAA